MLIGAIESRGRGRTVLFHSCATQRALQSITAHCRSVQPPPAVSQANSALPVTTRASKQHNTKAFVGLPNWSPHVPGTRLRGCCSSNAVSVSPASGHHQYTMGRAASCSSPTASHTPLPTRPGGKREMRQPATTPGESFAPCTRRAPWGWASQDLPP